MTPRPLWRWWLWCAALWLSWHTGWAWTDRLFCWCILPEWLHDGSPIDTSGTEPF